MKKIEIFYLNDFEYFKIEPLKIKREWMDKTFNKFSYKCIPINVANQNGWQVLSPIEFCANWNGGDSLKDVERHYHEETNIDFASSHFGNGILTIDMDFIIKTPKNISTHVRGIPNFPIDGMYPLEGVIETDWLPFTFTFNYKFTRPGEVVFQKGQPLFSFFPIKRGYIEKFNINRFNINKDEEVLSKYFSFKKSRQEGLSATKSGDKNIQGFYSKGYLPEFGKISDSPQKQIKLNY
jgi:hypothetical protein